MKRNCPNSECNSPRISKCGFFPRKADSRRIQRFVCKDCGKKFSKATGTDTFRMHVRREHFDIARLLCSGVSLNQTARLTKVSPSTVSRKLPFLAARLHRKNQRLLASRKKVKQVQFDELETIEHTKCKPIAVPLAVEDKTEIILAIDIARMPAKGPLADISRRKYGHRPNERKKSLINIMDQMRPYLHDKVHLVSDEAPLYAGIVKKTLSDRKVSHHQVKGARGCSTGQGELKKLVFDPLFSLNHTCAMLRAKVSRLIRKTWNTTKKFENLLHHLRIYVYVHNLAKIGRFRKFSTKEAGKCLQN